MPRKPVTELLGGKGPRQWIWEAIRRLDATGQPWTEEQIWEAMPRDVRLSVDLGAIRDYRRCLVAAEIVQLVTEARDRRVHATYCLVADEGLEAPRVRKDGSRVTQGLAQEQMWRALRMLTGDVNQRELAAHASTPSIPVAEAAAKDYLLVLNEAGYLIPTREAIGGRRGAQARYRLKPTRNTGPRPPMVCRTKVVYDPNEDKIVWQPAVTEEDALYAK